GSGGRRGLAIGLREVDHELGLSDAYLVPILQALGADLLTIDVGPVAAAEVAHAEDAALELDNAVEAGDLVILQGDEVAELPPDGDGIIPQVHRLLPIAGLVRQFRHGLGSSGS